MATTEANFLLSELENNVPKITEVSGGKHVIIEHKNKRYKVRPMVNAVADRMDRCATKAHLAYGEDESRLLVNMTGNRKLVSKVLSLMLLHSWFRVTFFHGLYWRYLYRFRSQEDMMAILEACYNMNSIGFFFQNLTLIMMNSQMIEKIAKANIINTEVKPEQPAGMMLS